MTLSDFLSKLNWRLILVHFVACWFLFHGSWQFGYLYHYSDLEKIVNHNYKGLTGQRISDISIDAAIGGLIGLLIGFVISLFLSLNNKWYWVNSLIVLLITFTVGLFNQFYWHHIRVIFQAPGRIFESDWAYDLTNGLVMLTIGLLLFFLNIITRFIDGKKLDPEVTPVPQM